MYVGIVKHERKGTHTHIKDIEIERAAFHSLNYKTVFSFLVA